MDLARNSTFCSITLSQLKGRSGQRHSGIIGEGLGLGLLYTKHTDKLYIEHKGC